MATTLEIQTTGDYEMSLLGLPDWSPSILEKAGLDPQHLTKIEESVDDYFGNFVGCFNTSTQMSSFFLYSRGLMSDIARKNPETIALGLGLPEKVRTLQAFLQTGEWSTEEMSSTHKKLLSESLSHENGVLIIDGCDIPKKGNETVGVARQYCGAAGKVDNCLAFMVAAYSSPRGSAVIDSQQYLPKHWTEPGYDEKREKTGIPDGTEFKTKNEIALDLIRSIHGSGMFFFRYVLGDGSFGHDAKFLNGLPKGVSYFATAHSDDKFFETLPEVSIPVWSGKGRPPKNQKASDKPIEAKLIVEESNTPWREVTFGLGSKGLVVGHEKLLRVWESRDGLPGELVWLHARRLSDGSVKYSISNAPADTPVEQFTELALRRWSIEQCFEECKTNLGMDHYEGRSWIGWRRHLLIVFVVHLFLQLMRAKHSIGFDDLSEQGKIVYKAVKEGQEDSRIIVLTTGNMCALIGALFTGTKTAILKAFRTVTYRIKRYAVSFFSNCKKMIPFLLGET